MIKRFIQFVNESEVHPYSVGKFIELMEKEMKWNGGELSVMTPDQISKFTSFPAGTKVFSYSCMSGQSVSKDLKEAALKLFGIKIKVVKVNSTEYHIAIK